MKTISLRPRFSETDALGHINNTAIAVWFEAGRVEYVDEMLRQSLGSAPSWVMATQTLDYLNESFFGSDVSMDLAVTRIGNSSFTVACRMYQNEKHTVKATAVLVFVDDATRRPSPIPEAIRSVLAAELDPDW